MFFKTLIEDKLKFGKGFERKLKQIHFWESLSADRLLEEAEVLFSDFKSKLRRNNFYKATELENIRSVKEIGQFPTLFKDDVKHDSLTLKSKRLMFKGYTSGTTGSPLVVYRDLSSIQWENAYVWNYRMSKGFEIGDSTLWIRGDVSKDQRVVYDQFSNTLKLSYYDLNEDTFVFYLKKIQKQQPKNLIAYPSAAYTLATLFEKHGESYTFDSVFTSSEVLFDYQIKKINSVFGSEVYDWYGNAERVSAFYLDKGVYKAPPLYGLLNFDKRDVEGYCATAFHNLNFPLVNYNIKDDISQLPSSVFLKEEVEINSGRSGSFVEFLDGTKVSNFNMIFKFNDKIEMSQIIQYKNGFVDINIVPAEGFTSFVLKDFKTVVESFLGKREEVFVNVINQSDIRLTKNGKYQLVVKIDDEKVLR